MTATVYAANSATSHGMRGRWKLPLTILITPPHCRCRLVIVATENLAGRIGCFDRDPFGISATQRAMKYLEDLCAIGPRASGTPGMQRQLQLLTDFFRLEGADVSLQTFRARHPLTGQAVEMNNIIASWFPDAPRRVLISAHYDTRPYPSLDPRRPQGTFIGANDGASGTAVLMELPTRFPN